ncbi:uncharacterized protein DFL_000633 [Arthrobotrys flagrans]|uniref:Aminoglycoside phosphotransferase domain-containing protein n=1 Tax=Arthrobotrys flagrans TaxID=97331 RepID=A0A437AEH3_ARTFL|nr:hypothetical protein DFL_000633 [Arthrobotrys flagrans]
MLPASEVLEWEDGLLCTQLIWKTEPSIDMVTDLMRSKIQDVSQDDKQTENTVSTATYIGGGAFNKLYLMDRCNDSWILRVTLPVDPYYKTSSEVATIKLIKSFTSLPVPRVIAHYGGAPEASPSDGCLGLEWILMTKLPGKNLTDAWSEMDIGKKIRVVELLADKLHELYTCKEAQFSSIGNVYQPSVQTDTSERGASYGPAAYTVGRIVSMPFFWNQRLRQPVNRGPFASSAEWLTSRLQLVEYECTQILNSDSVNSNEKEDAARFKSLSQRLSKHIQFFVPANEKFVLHHDDVNAGNILVDPTTGDLTGVLDWECVSVLPNWKSCQLPIFLTDTQPRNTKPSENAYFRNVDGSPNELYFHHLLEWELTMLGQYFLRRMESHNSDWIEIYKSSGRIRDFEYAVHECDSELMVKRIEKWLDIVERGEKYQRLLEYN